MASKNDLMRARSGELNLRGADLTDADLSGVDLSGTDLTGADLTDANLSGASLSANFQDARLFRAKMTGADLTGAHLFRADLSGADLTGADMTVADLTGAFLNDANLTDAKLVRASMAGATLKGATLVRVDLTDANLIGVNATDINLTLANMTGADLTSAKLDDAVLNSANLTNANLSNTNLIGARMRRVDLTRANLTGARLEGATLTGAKGLRDSRAVARGSGYGRASGAVLKLLGEGPQTARDFKRKYPAEFERIKGMTGGKDFDAAMIKSIVAQTRGARWLITKSNYTSTAQRLCAHPNDVLLFNVDLEAQGLDDDAKTQLRKLSEVSRRSGHPHEHGDKLFTVGWVRYCDGGKTWLIEEVQSDVYAARYGLKDERAREQLSDGGISPEQFECAIEALKPWTDRFYEDALGVTFALAKQKGIVVEMLTFESKRAFGSPKDLYSDLPRGMGMTRRERGEVLDAPAWHYRPNPSKGRRPAVASIGSGKRRR